MQFNDFNNAETSNFDLIKKGTIAKVQVKIKPGGYNDDEHGWTGAYVTKNEASDACYLNCEFTVLNGEHQGRKVWSLIGLYSSKNDNRWGNIGRGFIRAILNSSRGYSNTDESEKASQARKINSLAELDGIEFIAKIDVEIDRDGNDKNVIKTAIDPSHKAYLASEQRQAGSAVDNAVWG
ncbi:MAG: hypothetical protein COA94_01090 [Rickettsiales bacterium]|nr:MAG: hypothetical protein COA94_01090 [Rickettsiales bacterium]